MLELYGKGYVNEWCISLFHKEQEEKSYRIYVTDCLQSIAENTMHVFVLNDIIDYGAKMKRRWIDIIEPKEEAKKESKNENRSTKEIVDDMWSRMFRG